MKKPLKNLPIGAVRLALGVLCALLLVAPVIRLASLPAIVLAAVFTAGNLLADAPVRGPDREQSVIVSDAANPLTVAARVRTDFEPWRWQQYQLWKQEKKRELKNKQGCLVGILPGTDESELESSMEECGDSPGARDFYYRNLRNSDEAAPPSPFLRPGPVFPTLIITPRGGTNQ